MRVKCLAQEHNTMSPGQMSCPPAKELLEYYDCGEVGYDQLRPFVVNSCAITFGKRTLAEEARTDVNRQISIVLL